MEAKDNKRYFIGVMIPAKTFFDNLDALCMLVAKHNLGDVRGRHFDAVFYFDDRYREVLDYRTTEIRDDNYLDYILEKEGVVNHGRGM